VTGKENREGAWVKAEPKN